MYVIGCRESLYLRQMIRQKAGKVVDSFMSVVFFWTISITRALKDTQNLNLLLIFLGWIFFFVFFREPRSYYFFFSILFKFRYNFPDIS